MRKILIAVLLVLGACAADEAPLVATDVEIRAPLPGMKMSAGYLTLRNNSDGDITITKVTSPQFGAVEMHETRVEDEVSRMVALDAITVPAGSSVAFEPGGKHLMLMRPSDELDAVTLEFYAGPDVVLTLATTARR
jgi:copper(I)-binding protein